MTGYSSRLIDRGTHQAYLERLRRSEVTPSFFAPISPLFLSIFTAAVVVDSVRRSDRRLLGIKRFKRLSTAAFASVDSSLAVPHFSEDPLPCMFAHAHLTQPVLYPSLQDPFLSRVGLFFQHGLA